MQRCIHLTFDPTHSFPLWLLVYSLSLPLLGLSDHDSDVQSLHFFFFPFFSPASEPIYRHGCKPLTDLNRTDSLPQLAAATKMIENYFSNAEFRIYYSRGTHRPLGPGLG